MNDLALADELRGELRRSAALAGRAAQDERVAAVLDDRVRDRPAIGARHLTDRLEPENAASAELTQPRQGVLEAVDLPATARVSRRSVLHPLSDGEGWALLAGGAV